MDRWRPLWKNRFIFFDEAVFCERKPRDSRVVGKSLSGEKDKKTPNVLD